MELENSIIKDIGLDNNNTMLQNNFLETSLGKVINLGLDTGIRVVLPDLIENQVIEIKNAILKSGFKEGINQIIDSAINLGKSAIGIVKGNFENIGQVQNAIKKGGIIDSTSKLLSYAIDKAIKNNWISTYTGNMLKKGKNAILNSIENSIENNFSEQSKNIEELNKNIEVWKNNYDNEDFNGMEKAFIKIKEILNKTLPIENVINEARKIENIHSLIKNNGHNFQLSNEELKLANILI